MLVAATDAAPPPTIRSLYLWQIARMWIADAINASGGPGEIAVLIANHAAAP